MVYKQLSEEMRAGLKNIYQQISSASADGTLPAPTTDDLFNEASAQLGEIVKTTEHATMRIMEIVEKQFEQVGEIQAIIKQLHEDRDKEASLDRVNEICAAMNDSLTEVMTELGFQDLTGQRIKKVVAALNGIERSVVELYLSSGLIMDAAEKEPQKDAETLQAEARKAVNDFRDQHKKASTLKGPDSNGISQGAIDDMLAQLGL